MLFCEKVFFFGGAADKCLKFFRVSGFFLTSQEGFILWRRSGKYPIRLSFQKNSSRVKDNRVKESDKIINR